MYFMTTALPVLPHRLTRMNSIKSFIAEAEKESGAGHH